MKVGVQKILISVLQNFAPNSTMKFLQISRVSRINIINIINKNHYYRNRKKMSIKIQQKKLELTQLFEINI